MIDVSYSLSNIQTMLIVVLVIWDAVWKIFAAWKAAANKDRVVFIFILVINSGGIVPIMYLAHNKIFKNRHNS